MKKFLLTTFCALVSLMGMAQMTKPFEDNLVVTINGESTAPQKTTVYLTLNEDNTCDFALNNFMLDGGDGNMMPIGNIFIAGLPLTPSEEGYYTFSYEGNLLITAGDLEGYDTWLGPLLEEIPLKLTGKATMDKVYVTIDIDMMESIGQFIYVTFGSDFGAPEDLGMPFVDDLVVTINGESTAPQQTTIYLSLNEDNSCNFVLKNFMLDSGDGNMMPIGNIVLTNLPLVPSEEGYYTFSYEGNLLISAGDAPGYDVWLGPLLEEIPLKLNGKATMEKVYVTIDIDMMESIEQFIYVTFGTDFEPVTPPAPTTYALTFEVDGKVVSTTELEAGAAVTYPEVEPKEGYTFAWEGETVTAMPAEALTIKGGYTVNSYTINYYVNDALVSSQTVEFGAAVSPMGYELQEGYTFSGWDEVPATMPAHDVDVHATETVNSYTVTYVDGDKVIATFTVKYGDAMPDAPEYKPESDENITRTLLGWQGEVCNTMPAHDVTYTAVIDVYDAIQAVELAGKAEAYDLQGRRVNAATKGIRIINGKKVLK